MLDLQIVTRFGQWIVIDRAVDRAEFDDMIAGPYMSNVDAVRAKHDIENAARDAGMEVA